METLLSIIFTKAYAAAPVLEPTGAVGSTNADTLNISLGNLASISIDWLYALAGAIAFISIIWFGIKYITSNGDPKKAGEARSGLSNVIIGVIVVVAAYAIIKFAIGLGLLLQNQVKNTSNASSSSSSASSVSNSSSSSASAPIQNTSATNSTTEVITEGTSSQSSYQNDPTWSSIYGRIMGGE